MSLVGQRLLAVLFATLVVTSGISPGVLAAEGSESGAAETNSDIVSGGNAVAYQKMAPSGNFSVNTTAASDVGTYNATLNGEISDLTQDSVEVYFEFRQQSENEFRETERQTVSNESFSQRVEFLSPGTTFEFRAVAQTENGPVRAETRTFTTDSGGASDGFISATDNLTLFNLFFQGMQVDVESNNVGLETQIPPVFLNAEGLSPEVYPGEKGSVAVHNPNETLTFDFEDTGTGTIERFSGSQADIVAIKTDSTEGFGAFSQIGQLNEFLQSEDSTVEVFETTNIGQGEPITYDLQAEGRGGGNYIFLAVNNGSITVDDTGNATSENARILGLDFAIVQTDQSTIATSRPQYRPGENVTVNIQAPLPNDRENITQSVILYDENNFRFGADGEEEAITAQLNNLDNIDTDNLTITSTIAGFDTVQRTDEGATVLGQGVNERDTVGIFTVEDVFGVVGGGIGDQFQNTSDPVAEVDNASIVSRTDISNETTLELGTEEGFNQKTYSIIHIAENNETGAVNTNKTTVEITDNLDAYVTVDIDEETTDTQVASGEEATINATVENIGDSAAGIPGSFFDTVSITLGADGDQSTTIDSLSPGEVKNITFTYTQSETGVANLRIESAIGRTDFQGSDAEDSTTVEFVDDEFYDVQINEANSTLDVVENETAVVNTTVENTVNIDGDTQQINLTVNEQVVDSQSVTLNGGESTTFDLTFDTSQVGAGVFNATVISEDDSATTDITVSDAAEFNVTDLDPPSATVATDGTITVSANVTNVGGTTATQTVEFRINGTERRNQSVTLDGGNSTEVSFNGVPIDTGTGTFQYGVFSDDDSATGTLSVVEQLTAIETDPSLTSNVSGETADYFINVNVTSDSGGGTVQNITVGFGTESLNLSGATVDVFTNESLSGQVDRGDSTITIGLDTPFEIGTDEKTGDSIDVTVKNVTNPDAGTYNLTTEFRQGGQIFTFDTVEYTIVEPANFSVGALEVDATTKTLEDNNPVAGTEIFVNTTVENVGSAEGTKDVEFLFDGRVINTTGITLDAGGTQEFNFSVDTDESDFGQRNVTVRTVEAPGVFDDTETVNITVGRSATFQVDIDEDASDSQVVAGSNVTVVANVTNIGDVSDQQTITLNLSGETVATNSTSEIPPNTGAQEVTFEFDTSEANVAPGDTLNFTVASEDDSADLSVSVIRAATFDVNVTQPAEDEEFVAGEEINVTAEIENIGDLPATQDIQLLVNGTQNDTREVEELAAGGNETVNFTYQTTESDIGELNLTVASADDADTRNVTISQPATLSYVNFSVNGETSADLGVASGTPLVANATVTNVGGVNGTFNATLFQGGVSTENRQNGTLAPGETANVSFNITIEGSQNTTLSIRDAVQEGAQTGEVDVTVRPERVNLSLTVSPTEVNPGEDVELSVIQENTGNATRATVNATQNGTVIRSVVVNGTRNISFEEDETGTVELTARKESTNETAFQADSETIDVLARGDIQITDASANVSEAFAGDTVGVSVDLENVGDENATETVNLTADGSEDSQLVELGPGNSTTIDLQATFDTPGTRTLNVSDGITVTAGTVEVLPQSEITDFEVNTTSVVINRSVQVNITVRNRGSTIDDEFAVPLSINGTTENVTISSISNQSERTESFTRTLETLGDVPVAAGDLDPIIVTVSRETVDLEITADPSTVTTGENVTFTITRADTGAPVANATVTVADQEETTDSDGNVTVSLDETGEFTAGATKEPTGTEFFASDSTTVEVVEPADIEVTDVELVSESPFFAGNPVTVEVDLLNDGDRSGDRTLNLTANGTDVANDTVDVGASDTETVRLSATFNNTTTRALAIESRDETIDIDTITIERAAAVTDFELSSTALQPNTDTLFVNSTVENRGGVSDTVNVTVTIERPNGTTTTSTDEVTVESGNETESSFNTTFNANGTATVSVNDLDERDVTIAREVTDLSITANESTVTAGNPIRFNVTNASSGDGVEATVTVGDTVVTTDSDGLVTTTIRSAGEFTAVASKETENGTAFNSSQEQITVTDPLIVNDTVSYGRVNASPATGAARADTATVVRTVTLNNTGGRALALSLPQVVENSSQYDINESTFPSRLPVGATRTVEIEFAPTTRGEVNSTFRFRAGTPSEPIRTVNLTGIGESPQVDFNRTRLSFGGVNNDSTATAAINVTNTGNEPLNVTVPSPGDGFTRTSSGTLTIDNGSSQTITVEFAPTEPREFSQVLTVTTNDSFQPTQPVRLSGTSLGGAIAVSPAAGSSINVGNVTQGEPVETTVFVTNNGTRDISVTSGLNNTAEFSATDPGTVEPGSTELVTVTVNATTTSPAATLTLNTADNNVTDPTVTIAANGLTPVATVTSPSGTPPSIDFGNVSVGGSASEEITIRNDGQATLEVDAGDAVPANTPFSVSGTGTSDTVQVAPGESDTVTVTYAPGVEGTQNATVTLTTNDQTLSVDVNGTGEATELVGTPSSIDFGQVGQGGDATRTVELTNPASNAESLEDFSVESVTGASGAYSVVRSDLPDTLDPDESQNVTIEFEPTAVGSQSASITFAANGSDSGNTSQFTVSATGEGTPPRVSVNTTTLRFGFVQTGANTTEAARITNDGLQATTLNVSSVSISGPNATSFDVTSQPDSTVGGSDATDVGVSFTPTTDGRQTATLTIRTNASDDPVRNVTLTGAGTAPDTAVDDVSGADLSAIGFGEQPVDTTSANRTVVVTNDGGVPLNLSGVSLSGSDDDAFEAFGPGETTLVPGETVQVPVRVTPSDAGSTSATLAINATNDPNSAETVSLTADATAPELNVTGELNASGDFGNVSVGSASQRSLTVENTGNATLELDEPVTGGAFSVVSGDDAVRLAPGGTQTYVVAFAPVSASDFTGSLSIETNADSDVEDISLSGDGVTANASLSQSAVDFGRVSVGDEQTSELTIRNFGGEALQVTSVSIVGADPAAFSVSGLQPTTIGASGGNQSFNVTTSPSVTGSVSAQLEIRTNDTTVTASLGTTGTEPNIELETASLDFEQTRVGDTSTATLTVSNTGNEELNVTGLNVLGQNSGRFSVATSSSSFTLQPQTSREVTVEFEPTNVAAAQNEQPRTARIRISSDDPDARSVSADLTATGKTTDLIAPGAVQFGATPPGTTTNQTVTITNGINASANLTLEAVTVSDVVGEDVYVTDRSEDATTTLEPGESETVNVSLSPEERGVRFGSLNVLTNDPRQRAASVFLSNAEAVINIKFGSVTAEYRNIDTGLQPQRNFDQGISADAAITGIQPATQKRTYELFFDGRSTAFRGDSVTDDDYTAVRYLDADLRSITPTEITNVSVEYRVSKAALARLGASRDDVRLLRYDGTEYVPVEETSRIGETRTDQIYRSTTTEIGSQGQPQFAIAVGQADVSVTNVSVSPNPVTEGNRVTVTATVNNTGTVPGDGSFGLSAGDISIPSKSTGTISAGDSTTITFTFTTSTDSDTQDETVTVSVGGASTTLTVNDPDTADDGDGDGGGGGGAPPAPAPQPQTNIEGDAAVDASFDGQTLSVNVQGAGAGDSVETRLDEQAVNDRLTDTGSSLNSLQVIFEQDTGFSADVSQSVNNPSETTPNLDDETGAEAISYINVEESIDDDDIDTVEFEFSVSRERLERSDLSTDQISLYRYNGQQWEEYDATVASEGDDRITYTATVPGLSVFAIGAASEQATATPEPGTATPEPDTVTPEPEPDTATPEPDVESPTEAPPEEPGGFDPILIVVVVIVLAAAGLAVYFGRQE